VPVPEHAAQQRRRVDDPHHQREERERIEGDRAAPRPAGRERPEGQPHGEEREGDGEGGDREPVERLERREAIVGGARALGLELALHQQVHQRAPEVQHERGQPHQHERHVHHDPAAAHRRLDHDRAQPGGQPEAQGQDHRQHEGAERADAALALHPEVEQDHRPDQQRDRLGQRRDRQASQLEAPQDDRAGVADEAGLGQQQRDPCELVAPAGQRADRGRRGQDVGGQGHVEEDRVHRISPVSGGSRCASEGVARQ
jgi:hypothetical protein